MGACDCTHEVKVTRIGDGYNIRVLMNGNVNQESRVYNREHISTEIYHMLRMEDKCGNISNMASRCRDRYNEKLNKKNHNDEHNS
jgi:hypothetical protein